MKDKRHTVARREAIQDGAQSNQCLARNRVQLDGAGVARALVTAQPDPAPEGALPKLLTHGERRDRDDERPERLRLLQLVDLGKEPHEDLLEQVFRIHLWSQRTPKNPA